MKTKINFAIKSTKGKRPINQDSLICTYNLKGDFIAVCCDGIGSVNKSELASQTICDIFADQFEHTLNIDKPIIWAKKVLALAVEKLKHLSLANNCPNVATTLALLMIVDGKWYACNVGDTRIYGIKNEQIVQLTIDHNYYNYLLSKKTNIKVLEANRDKWFALTKYIEGGKPQKAVLSVTSGPASDYKYFLISTDGMYGYVETTKMTKVVNIKCLPLVCRSSKLNRLALKYNSTDNVSNIIVSCKVYDK